MAQPEIPDTQNAIETLEKIQHLLNTQLKDNDFLPNNLVYLEEFYKSLLEADEKIQQISSIESKKSQDEISEIFHETADIYAKITEKNAIRDKLAHDLEALVFLLFEPPKKKHKSKNLQDEIVSLTFLQQESMLSTY